MTDRQDSSTGKYREVVNRFGPLELPYSTPAVTTVWKRPGNTWIETDADREWLRWDGLVKDVPVDSDRDLLLHQFMLLADADSAAVADFARRWGVLSLCEHGVPHTHIPSRVWTELDITGQRPCAPIWRPGGPRETVDDWRKHSRQALAVFMAAGILKKGELIPEDLEVILGQLCPAGWPSRQVLIDLEPRSQKTLREYDEYTLTLALRRWLELGDVGYQVRWYGIDPDLRFGGVGLAGAIAMQLALTTSSATSHVQCSGCRELYHPNRAPRSGQANYCEECRSKGEPARVRQRRKRRRDREEASTDSPTLPAP